MSNHTPGPWIANGNYPENQAIIYDEATGTNIAVVYTGDEDNAHLIAAAPDLLAALKLTVKELKAWQKDHGKDIATQEALADARAAIRKAEGTP